MTPQRTPPPRCAGISLIESVVSVALLSILASGAMTTVSSVSRARVLNTDRQVGHALAAGLAQELAGLSFADPQTASSVIGTDSGETTSDRASWDDVDDADGFSDTQTAGGLSYTRHVAVSFLQTADLTAASAVATDHKQLTVEVRRGDRVVARVHTVRVAAWPTALEAVP